MNNQMYGVKNTQRGNQPNNFLARVEKAAAIAAYRSNGDSRARMLTFLNSPDVPEKYKNELRNGNMRLVDHTYYCQKPAQLVTKFFISGDAKTTGLTNVDGNRIIAGSGFLVSAIGIRTAVATGATVADYKAAKFTDTLEAVPGGFVSDVSFQAQNKYILQEAAGGMFCNKTTSKDEPFGIIKLDNPRFIDDTGIIAAEIVFGDLTGMAANTVICFTLHGTSIVNK